MTYILESELQGALDLMVLCYAKFFPTERPEVADGTLEPGDSDPFTDDPEVRRQRMYGRLEGFLLAMGVDVSNPCVQVSLHEEIAIARLFLARVGGAAEAPLG